MTEATVTSSIDPCSQAGSEGAACDDGSACTSGEKCQAGVCAGGVPKTCQPSDQCHVAGVCDPGTGLCSNPVVADGTGCDDGSACTQTDTCQGGSCVGASPVTCAAIDACHLAGSCNPGNGVCDNPLAPDGTVCPGGACSAGVCLAQDAAAPDAAEDVVVGPDAAPEAGEDVVIGPDAEPDAEQDAQADAIEPDVTEPDVTEPDVIEADVVEPDAPNDAIAADGPKDGPDVFMDAKADAPAQDGAPADAAGDAATADAKDSAAGKDAKDDGAAGAAADPNEVEGGGCGCRTAGAPSSTPAGLIALLALIGIARRRR